MAEYLGNVFADVEKALELNARSMTLTAEHMRQALRLMAEVTEAKNELVRENWRLREAKNA